MTAGALPGVKDDLNDFEDKEERRFRDDEQLIMDDFNQYENEWENE
jgi:hypothetical protein